MGVGDPATLCVVGGHPPYTWSVTQGLASLVHSQTGGRCNTLQVDAGACGTIVVTVDDRFGATTTLEARAPGHWELKSNTCGLSGAGGPDGSGDPLATELIVGGKRQTQLTTAYGACCENGCPGDETTCGAIIVSDLDMFLGCVDWQGVNCIDAVNPAGQIVDCTAEQHLICDPACTCKMGYAICGGGLAYYEWECP